MKSFLVITVFILGLFFTKNVIYAQCVDQCRISGPGSCSDCGGGCQCNGVIGSCSVCYCVPNCTARCGGASNGCGGTCNAPCSGGGSCTPKCNGDQCGQSDGCGGVCPSTDKNACGKCGNSPCQTNTEPCYACSGANSSCVLTGNVPVGSCATNCNACSSTTVGTCPANCLAGCNANDTTCINWCNSGCPQNGGGGVCTGAEVATNISHTCNNDGTVTISWGVCDNCSSPLGDWVIDVNYLPDEWKGSPYDVIGKSISKSSRSYTHPLAQYPYGGVSRWGNEYIVELQGRDNCLNSALGSRTYTFTCTPSCSVSGPTQVTTGENVSYVVQSQGGGNYTGLYKASTSSNLLDPNSWSGADYSGTYANPTTSFSSQGTYYVACNNYLRNSFANALQCSGNPGGGNWNDCGSSDLLTVNVCAMPGTPSGLSPSGVITSYGGLSWNPTQNTDFYSLRIDDMNNGWSNNCSALNQGDKCVTTASNSYSAAQWSPTPGVWYGWWVHSQNNCNINYWNASAATNFCLENQTCAVACGQTKACGGNCPSSAASVPAQTSVVSPLGSAAAPVILTGGNVNLGWSQANTSNTTGYEWVVENNGTGAVVTSGTTTSGVLTGVASASWLPNVTYRWKVRAINATCNSYSVGVVNGTYSGYGYFRINSVPTITDVVIKNINNQTVNTDPSTSGSANQICQKDFVSGSSQTRRAKWVVTVSDADGVSDIGDIKLNLSSGGNNFDVTSSSSGFASNTAWLNYTNSSRQVAGNTLIVTFDLIFANNFPVATYDVTVVTSDKSGMTATKVLTKMRIWNCQVAVVGYIFDSSADSVVSCFTGAGYSTPFAGTDFREPFSYNAGGLSSSMRVLSQYTYNSNGNYLMWGQNYVPNFTPFVNAFSPLNQYIRVTSLGPNSVECSLGSIGVGTDVNSAVNPALAYQDNPTIQVDYTTIRFFDGWYQSLGAGVLGGNRLNDAVPPTCSTVASCRSAISVDANNSSDGLVAAGNLSTFANCSGCLYSSPNNWYGSTNTMLGKYSYEGYYNDLYLTKNLGNIYSGTTLYSQIIGDTGGKGVVFVDGDLVIDRGNNLPVGSYFMVIVRGKITVLDTVPASASEKVEGVFFSNGNFSVLGQNSNQLVIEGSIYSKQNIILQRNLTPKDKNNTLPAVVVSHRADLLFSLPPQIRYTLSTWREGSR